LVLNFWLALWLAGKCGAVIGHPHRGIIKTSMWKDYVIGWIDPTYVISLCPQAKWYVLIWFKYLIPLTCLKNPFLAQSQNKIQEYLPDFCFKMCIAIVLDITSKNNAKYYVTLVSILSPFFGTFLKPFTRCIDQFEIFQSWYNASHWFVCKLEDIHQIAKNFENFDFDKNCKISKNRRFDKMV